MTDKFKDIKVGDVIYVETNVSDCDSGWTRRTKDFYLPQKVISVSPKRFKTSKSSYNQSDGSPVPRGYGFARYLGEEIKTWADEEIVIDQTNEAEKYERDTKQLSGSRQMLGKLKYVDFKDDEISKLHQLLKEVKNRKKANEAEKED